MKSTRRHTSLTLKMNLLIVAAILLVSAGLVFGTYQVYCQKIESLYDERIADALRADHLSVLPVYSSVLIALSALVFAVWVKNIRIRKVATVSGLEAFGEDD